MHDTKMRCLGIDYGTKKVGLALSDEAGMMAFPHSVIANDAHFLPTVVALIEQTGVGAVVVGESLDLDGAPNALQSQIEQFITELTLQTPIPVYLEPEQFTSRQAGISAPSGALVDAGAATIILNSFLDKQCHMNSKPDAKEETVTPVKPEIAFEQFAALDVRIGEIVSADLVEGADKLLRLMVDVGEAESRQIISGIREFFPDPSVLVSRRCPFVLNLAPRKIRGLVSNGMIMAAGDGPTFSLLTVDEAAAPGTMVG